MTRRGGHNKRQRGDAREDREGGEARNQKQNQEKQKLFRQDEDVPDGGVDMTSARLSKGDSDNLPPPTPRGAEAAQHRASPHSKMASPSPSSTPTLESEVQSLFERVELEMDLEKDGRHHTNPKVAVTPRDLRHLLQWTLPTTVPLVEAPRVFLLRNKAAVRHVLYVYVDGWSYDLVSGAALPSDEDLDALLLQPDTEEEQGVSKNGEKGRDNTGGGPPRKMQKIECRQDGSSSSSSHDTTTTEIQAKTTSSSSSLLSLSSDGVCSEPLHREHVLAVLLAKLQRRLSGLFLFPLRSNQCWAREPSMLLSSSSSSSPHSSSAPMSLCADTRSGVLCAPLVVPYMPFVFEKELFWTSSSNYSGGASSPGLAGASGGGGGGGGGADGQKDDGSATPTHKTHNSNDSQLYNAHRGHNNNSGSSSSGSPSSILSPSGGVGSRFERAKEWITTTTRSSHPEAATALSTSVSAVTGATTTTTSSPAANRTKLERNQDVQSRVSVPPQGATLHGGESSPARSPSAEELENATYWNNRALLQQHALHLPEHTEEFAALGFTLAPPGREETDPAAGEDEKGGSSWKWFPTPEERRKRYSAIRGDEEEAEEEGGGEGDDPHSPPRVVAFDCEMVLVEGNVSALARATLLDAKSGEVLLDRLVKPHLPVVNYLTRYSGVDATMLEDVTTTLEECQEELLSLIDTQTFLVGHSLENDLKACQLFPNCYVLDSAFLFPHPAGLPCKNALRFLVQRYFGLKIQQGSHDPTEDAWCSAQLVVLKLKKGPGFGTPVRKSVLCAMAAACEDFDADDLTSGTAMSARTLPPCQHGSGDGSVSESRVTSGATSTNSSPNTSTARSTQDTTTTTTGDNNNNSNENVSPSTALSSPSASSCSFSPYTYARWWAHFTLVDSPQAMTELLPLGSSRTPGLGAVNTITVRHDDDAVRKAVKAIVKSKLPSLLPSPMLSATPSATTSTTSHDAAGGTRRHGNRDQNQNPTNHPLPPLPPSAAAARGGGVGGGGKKQMLPTQDSRNSTAAASASTERRPYHYFWVRLGDNPNPFLLSPEEQENGWCPAENRRPSPSATSEVKGAMEEKHYDDPLRHSHSSHDEGKVHSLDGDDKGEERAEEEAWLRSRLESHEKVWRGAIEKTNQRVMKLIEVCPDGTVVVVMAGGEPHNSRDRTTTERQERTSLTFPPAPPCVSGFRGVMFAMVKDKRAPGPAPSPSPPPHPTSGEHTNTSSLEATPSRFSSSCLPSPPLFTNELMAKWRQLVSLSSSVPVSCTGQGREQQRQDEAEGTTRHRSTVPDPPACKPQ